MSTLNRSESRFILANIVTRFYQGIEWLVPIALLTFIVGQFLPDAWTSWVVAVMIAVLIGAFVQNALHWLCQRMFLWPKVRRVLDALSPPLKLKSYVALDALRRQNPTAFDEGIFSELHRDVLFMSNADAYREWCEEQSTVVLHGLRRVAIMRSPQWPIYAVILLVAVV